MTTPTSTPRTLLLVHGAWHGAWCWATLQAELDRRGLPSFAIDLPGHGISPEPLADLHTDAAAVAAAVDAIGRRTGNPVVLVGHSYGGAVITEAATRTDAVGHLVYLTAFVLDAGESVIGLLQSLPQQAVTLSAAMVPQEDGTTVVDLGPNTVQAFYGRCEQAAIDAALPRLSAQTVASFVQPATAAPWRTTPSTYVLCDEDQAIHPDHQAAMAGRCDTVHHIATDHSPFLSAVDATADILEALVR